MSVCPSQGCRQTESGVPWQEGGAASLGSRAHQPLRSEAEGKRGTEGTLGAGWGQGAADPQMGGRRHPHQRRPGTPAAPWALGEALRRGRGEHASHPLSAPGAQPKGPSQLTPALPLAHQDSEDPKGQDLIQPHPQDHSRDKHGGPRVTDSFPRAQGSKTQNKSHRDGRWNNVYTQAAADLDSRETGRKCQPHAGAQRTPRGSAHKLWALEKIALPLWGCFPHSQNERASPEKPRVLSQPTKTTPHEMAGRMLYPWGWGLGQERGHAAALGGPRSASPPRTRSPRHGRDMPSAHAALIPTVQTAVQPMATSRGASVPRRAPHPSTSVKRA